VHAWWGKPEGKRPLGRIGRRRKDNIKMYPQEIGWVGVDWTSGVPRGGLGCSNPPLPPKFGRYRWSPRSHEQEEPASRFPFGVHCVLIRL